MKTDNQIQQDIISELKWDPLLHPSAVGVSVINGIVTLSGQVETFFEKVEAEKASRKVAGVRAVAIDIQVGISPANFRTDAEIAEAILNGLKWHVGIAEEQIIIKVEDGIVTLHGQVDRAWQRTAVKEMVSKLAGVRSVINLIAVKPGLVQVDIDEKIQNAFKRNSTVNAGNISATVRGHEIVLEGTVNSYAEKNAAKNIAWSAPGIIEVDNRLKVERQEECTY